MNYEEARKVLTLLKTAYPNSYTHLDAESSALLIDIWSSVFAKMPVELISAAVKDIIANDTREFAPHPADVNRRIVSLISDDDDTAALKVWEDVVDISGSMYDGYDPESIAHNRRLYGTLPYVAKKIYTVNDVCSLGLQDIRERDMYEKPRFLRLYKSLKVQEEQDALRTGNLSRIASRQKMESIGLDPTLIDLYEPKRIA